MTPTEVALIRGHGASNSTIMFVGDFPSKIEVEKEFALVGFSEDIIDTFLKRNQASIKNFYRTVFVKEKIDALGFSKQRDQLILEQLQPKLENFKNILIEEIKEINPNVIVPLGELALNFLASEHKLDKFRGSVLNLSPEIAVRVKKELYDKIKVIPTWHPRELIRSPEKKPIAALDFKKITSFRNNSAPIHHKYNVWVCRSCNDFNSFLGRHPKPEFGVFDIETHHGFITCISFCFDGVEACSVPLLDTSMPLLDRVFLFERVGKILRSNNYEWVNQNILYDLTVNSRYGLYVKNIVGDTLLAQHTLYVEMLKGLDFLTSIYTDVPYYKDEGKEYDPKLGHSKDQLYLYNAKDALTTWIVWKEQLREFNEDPIQKAFFFDLNQLDFWKNSPNSGYTNDEDKIIPVPQGVMPLFHTYRKINRRGIRIDEEKRKKLKIKYNAVLNSYISDISSTIGREVNIRSPKQVQELVYNELQCPRMYKFDKETGEKKLDTGREALEEICFNKLDSDNINDASRITLLKKIIYGRKTYKIVKYLELPIHPDGRMRTNYKLAGTKSGRSSGSSTIDKYLCLNDEGKVISLPESKKQGLGTSFQTIPKHGFIDDEAEDGYDTIKLGKDIMEIFVPSENYVFFDGDKSQAEARIVAVLANDFDILVAFDKPRSYIHRLTASWIYKCSPDDIKKGSDEYETGKRARHGANYDMQAFRFSRMCHIALSQSEIILARVHQNQSTIRGIFHATIRETVYKSRLLVNPYGRQRIIFTPPTDKNMKDFISWIPQGTCSDGTKFALERIEFAAKEKSIDAQNLMEVHDNLIFEVHKDHVERFAPVYKTEMEKPIDFRHLGTFRRNFELIIPVELGIGTENLGNMKDYVM